MLILGGCIGRGALVALAALQIPSWYNGRKKKASVTWCFLPFFDRKERRARHALSNGDSGQDR